MQLAARTTGSHGPAPESTSATDACPAARSHRRRATAAVPATTTSARVCAAGAIPAAPSTSGPARAAWLGASTPATTGPAGRAAGGRPTTRRAPAPSAAAPATSATDRHVACALRMPDSSRSPAAPPTWLPRTSDSQQLFFANMVFKRRVTPLPDYVSWDGRWSKKNKNQLPYQPGTRFDEDASEQLTLFDMDPDPEVLRQRILVEDSELTRYCAAIVADHARRYGWSVRQRNAVIQSLRMLQTLPVHPHREGPRQRRRGAAPLRRHHHLHPRRPRRSRAAHRGRPHPGRAVLQRQVHRIRSPPRRHAGAPPTVAPGHARRIPTSTSPAAPRTRDRRDPHPGPGAGRPDVGRSRATSRSPRSARTTS